MGGGKERGGIDGKEEKGRIGLGGKERLLRYTLNWLVENLWNIHTCAHPGS